MITNQMRMNFSTVGMMQLMIILLSGGCAMTSTRHPTQITWSKYQTEQTELMCAVKKGDMATVMNLVETRGVDINARCRSTKDGNSALSIAVLQSDEQMVRYLLSKGADAGATVVYLDAEASRVIGPSSGNYLNLSTSDFLMVPGYPEKKACIGELARENGNGVILELLRPKLPSPDYLFTVDKGAVTITHYIGNGNTVTIPSTIIGLPVTHIGCWAFADCKNVTNVTIPNCVTHIAEGAFSGCSSLSNIEIPSTITHLGYSVFSLTALTDIIVPNSMVTIEKSMFLACTNLTTAIIPRNITTIGNSAFRGCRKLTNVEIPNSVSDIGSWAFSACPNIVQMTIPESVVVIGRDVFDDCTSLKALYFKGNAPILRAGEYPPLGKPNFAEKAIIYYAPGTTGWGKTYGGRPTALIKY